MPLPTPRLKIENLARVFDGRAVVDDVSLSVQAGQVTCLLGPSGCGKSTLGRAVLRLQDPTSGQVVLNGDDLMAMNHQQLTDHRRQMQIIFQDPYSSLDPRKSVRRILGEARQIHSL